MEFSPIKTGFVVKFDQLMFRLRFILQILIREKIDVVHGHQAFSVMALEAIFHSQTMGYRYIVLL